MTARNLPQSTTNAQQLNPALIALCRRAVAAALSGTPGEFAEAELRAALRSLMDIRRNLKSRPLNDRPDLRPYRGMIVGLTRAASGAGRRIPAEHKRMLVIAADALDQMTAPGYWRSFADQVLEEAAGLMGVEL